jgi:hypothetical protein
MVLYAYVLCLCILASSRIPWYDIGRQTPAVSEGVLSHARKLFDEMCVR